MLINSAATFTIQLLKTPLTPTQNTAATTFAISPTRDTATALLLLPTIILTTTIVFVDDIHAQSVPVHD